MGLQESGDDILDAAWAEGTLFVRDKGNCDGCFLAIANIQLYSSLLACMRLSQEPSLAMLFVCCGVQAEALSVAYPQRGLLLGRSKKYCTTRLVPGKECL